jgi:hypothetical protein
MVCGEEASMNAIAFAPEKGMRPAPKKNRLNEVSR